MRPYSLLPALLCLLLLAATTFAQQRNIVSCDSIIYPVHKMNTGKVVFLGRTIPLNVLKEADFLEELTLRDKQDLDIRVFMNNSLTNYLHRLSPQTGSDTLAGNGNYQFTFFVDGEKIYTEELHPGAGSADSKHRRTTFRIPLISSSNEDSWGRFLWNRFLLNGGQDALAGGKHTLLIEIRPYLRLNKVLTGEVIASGQVRIIVPEKKVNALLIKIQRIKPQRDWPLSEESVDSALLQELNKKIITGVFKEITSLVVIKNGKLLVEEYFNHADRNTLHDTRSVGKTFASALLGMAISDGYIAGEQKRLGEFYNMTAYRNYSLYKDSMTLKDLLTMSSVFKGNDMEEESPGNEEKMYPAANWVEFALNLPVDTTKLKKKRWEYFTAGVVVLGDIMHKSVPGGLEKYADKKLFRPLSITKYRWEHTPQKVVSTAGGLRLRALDHAKFGQLYKNGGAWNGQQLLPEEWVSRSLSKQIAVSEKEFYGYLFWNKTYKVKEKEYEAYYASGNGGNKIFIFKDSPLVVVITSKAFNAPYAHLQVDRIMQKYLLPAVNP